MTLKSSIRSGFKNKQLPGGVDDGVVDAVVQQLPVNIDPFGARQDILRGQLVAVSAVAQ
jgi:hypothetical protein